MFSAKSLVAVLAMAQATSALKFDCWSEITCTGSPGGGTGCGCEPDPNNSNLCAEDGMPCNQAASPEMCFIKGALSATVWGDTDTGGSSGTPYACFMNKYDCWSDCECSKEDYLQPGGTPFTDWYNPANGNNPANAMGDGVARHMGGKTGWEKCFENAGTNAGSASIWGHSFWNVYKAQGAYVEEPAYTVTNGMFINDRVVYQCEQNPAEGCESGGAAWGDPHFRTQDGEIFDFQGECDLVFLEAPSLDLSVHVRTKLSKEQTYSYIEAAALTLNGETVEIGDYGSIIVNGVYNADDRELPPTVGGYPLELERSDKKTHTYRIILDRSLQQYIELKSFTFMVGVSVMLPQKDMEGATGLFGSAKRGGVKYGRDGVTQITDLVEYGKEWVVGPNDGGIFETPPEHPGVCRMPSVDYLHHPRVGGITQKQAEKACAHMGLNKKACVTDVLAANDLQMAAAY